MQYTVREARRDDPRDASQLADLWNVSDINWPGSGLLHGVPMTAERMGEQLRQRDLILVLVAELDSRIIGYLGVREVPGRDDVAQGATITVRPEWLGKGCGKALLLDVLNRLTNMGYRQYRRTTWSGNLKAIPLYKKVGDFWEPGTSARLQNFIPTALTLPIARGFFDRHDWYRSFRRDLTVVPDDIRWRGIRVYPYRFESADDVFVMVIDRQAEAPTAVETNEVFVSCYLGQEEVVCGLPHTLTWEITNKRDDGRPLRVEISAKGPPGMELSVAESFEIADSLRFQRSFVVPPAIERPKHAIRSTFVIDGVSVTLSTGFRTAQPIEIDVQGLEPVPGKPDEEVVVRLRNRLKTAVVCDVCFEPAPGLVFNQLSAPVSLPPSSWGTCRFQVAAGEEPCMTHVRAVCPPERNAAVSLAAPLETRAKPVIFRPVPLDRVYAWEDGEHEEVRIEAPAFRVRVHLRGGGFFIDERRSGLRVIQQNPLAVERCAHRLDTADRRVRLTLEIPLPGLIVERTLTVGAGPFLRLDHRVRNTTDVVQQPQLLCPGEILVHRGVTVPLAGGLVHEIIEGLGDFPLAGGDDLPSEPAAYGEGWTAREENGLVAGIVWKSCGKIDGGSVRLDLPAIPPGAWADAGPLHFVVARGDWEVVRDLWRRLWQPGGVREEGRPATFPVLSAAFEPSPLLVVSERTAAPLWVRNRRLHPFAGRWELRAKGFQSEPAEGTLSGVTLRSPWSQELSLTCADLTPRVLPAAVTLSSEATTDERRASIIVVGDASRGVSVQPLGEGELYRVDNGWLSFDVAPGHHGSMISLRRAERELLVSSFPAPRPYHWIPSWSGGVEPFLQQPGDVRHARDSFTGEPVERPGARGLTWRGMRLTGRIRNPGTLWLRLTIEYLTTGASNLVALVLRLTNGSGASQEAPAGFIVFPSINAGTRVHYEVHRPEPGGPTTEREAVLRQRSSIPPAFRFGDARWVAMDTEDSLLTLVSLPCPGEAGAWLTDQETAGLHTSSLFHLGPGETLERLAWLAVAGDPEHARGYQALGMLGDLP